MLSNDDLVSTCRDGLENLYTTQTSCIDENPSIVGIIANEHISMQIESFATKITAEGAIVREKRSGDPSKSHSLVVLLEFLSFSCPWLYALSVRNRARHLFEGFGFETQRGVDSSGEVSRYTSKTTIATCWTAAEVESS